MAPAMLNRPSNVKDRGAYMPGQSGQIRQASRTRSCHHSLTGHLQQVVRSQGMTLAAISLLCKRHPQAHLSRPSQKVPPCLDTKALCGKLLVHNVRIPAMNFDKFLRSLQQGTCDTPWQVSMAMRNS